MPSLFSQRFEDVAMPIMETWLGIAVTLRSGANETASFTALSSDREYSSIEFETGLQVKVIARDWLLPASSLVIAGEEIDPTAGMLIIEGDDEYEVLPIQGRPAAEMQPDGYRWLVHTKQIKVG